MQCIGRNANDTKALVLQHFGQDFPYEEFRGRVSDWFWQEIERDGIPVKKGVRELLAFLKENKWRTVWLYRRKGKCRYNNSR